MKPVKTSPGWTRRALTTLGAVAGVAAGLSSTWATPPPAHDIVAANIAVTINSFDNDTNSVTLTTPYTIGDFRVVPSGSNNGDYDTQVGPERTNDVLDGVMISSVRENGRDDGSIIYPGVNLCTSHIDYHRPGATNDAGELVENSYWIPIALTYPNAFGTTVKEWDINVAAGWFPYAKWIGGFARNATGQNGGPLDLLTGSAGLALGTNFKDLGGGRAVVDLTSFGIDSRTDGVLLVMGAKNEDNYGLSQVNTNDGTWNLFSKDNGTDGGSTEQDPLAFVFIPKSDTNVVSGRFLGNGTIDLFSGDAPQFTIANVGTGQWELKIPGRSPRVGVLLLSPEGGRSGNQDNMVTYQVNDAGDGWLIQSYDLPSGTNDFGALPPFFPPPLETPGDGTEPVADFVFIPGATPGFVVTPTNGLFTTENGDTATFTVALEAPPISDVTIAVSSGNPAEGAVTPASLTFTPDNWNVPQTVTVTGQDDAVADGSVAYNIVLAPATSADPAYNGIDPADVAAVNADNETGGIIVSPTGGLTTTEAGGTATFTVRLSTPPTADVTIGLSSSDATEGTVSPDVLTFNAGNWDQEQTVTVTGVDDFTADGDVAYSIVTAPAVSADSTYNGLNPPNVTVANLDNDTVGLSVNTTGSGVSVVEGQTASYTVALNSQPGANVTVAVTSGDPAQGGSVTPASLTFTPADWNVPQTVTVSGADDLLADGDVAWSITNKPSSTDPAYNALAAVTVAATTMDNEAVLTLPSGEVSYGVGSPAVGLDGRATLTDPYAPDYNGGTLTVALVTNRSAGDLLALRNDGSGPGQVGVSGGNVTFAGTTIGTVAGGTADAPLLVTFNNAATVAAAEAVVRCVTFANTNTHPSLARRTVEVTLTHPDGGVAAATTTVHVGLVRVADFQEGADHGYGVYTGEADLELFETQSYLAFPAGHSGTTNSPLMWLDARAAGTTEEAQALMRFDNLVGPGPGQIPPGATVVSAELILNLPGGGNSQGDGSPLFRMLVPWDADFDTWDSLGGGIHPDDFQARSTYESQIGVAAVSGDTGTGAISVGVTADVQAWVNGETNYGWAMTSWDQDLNGSWSRGTDGMAFNPSETPNVDNRPRLRVRWVPAATAAVSFRQGVNGYTNAADTRIRARALDADTDFSTASSVFVDWAVDGGGENDEQVLLRFDNLIGTNPGQIPPGARIDAAMLDLATVIGNGYGDGGQLFAMFMPWQDTNTWNTLGGVQADGVKAALTPTASAGSPALNPNVCGGYLSFDVTPDVQTWADGARPNYGWAILPWPNGGDGWGLSMSEAANERDRPQLRVFFTPRPVLLPLVRSGNSVQLQVRAAAGDTYDVLRAPAPGGPWTSIGVVQVGDDGVGSFTDATPPAEAGFYKVAGQ